jgi:enoyl-CoA hydratase/carnithine racemase
MTQNLTLELAAPVARIGLARPEKLNALTREMLAGLDAACAAIEARADIRAVVLAAEGRAFCVGADIEAWSALAPLEMWRSWTRTGHRIFGRLARLRQPVIAAIEGPALGGGLELAACADLRIAAPGARFGLPEAGIAAIPGWSGTQRLARRAGSQAVRRLALAAEPVDAETALRLGLIDEIAPAGAVRARAEAIAALIAIRAPVSVQLAKSLVNLAEGEETGDAMEAVAAGLAALTEDAREGAESFRARRPPDFRGR